MPPLLDPDRALALVIENASGPQPERQRVTDAVGRILLEPVTAVAAQPPFTKSMMDGFAVRCADAGSVVRCVGEAAAGSVTDAPVTTGQVVEIMTGAPCPRGTEAVVKVEDVERLDGGVKLPEVVEPGAHIQTEGMFCRPGDEVLPAGAVVSPLGLATLIAVGVSEVVVAKAPSLTVITTGNELVGLGGPLGPAQIYNSNGPMLQAMARFSGVVDVHTVHADDTRESLHTALRSADASDIVVLTGGVSMGRYDLVPEVLTELGWQQVFHKVRQKPGKPILFSQNDGHLVFGLPGTPLGSHFGFHRYVGAAIRKRLGLKGGRPQHNGRLAERLRSSSGRTLFRLARALREGDGWHIRPLSWGGSSDLVGPGMANCYLRLEPGEHELKAGTELSFEFVDGTMEETWLS